MSVRVIPRLDIKGPNLVKGIHLEGLRVLGKPWDFALKYYENGADELIYMDSVASLYGRNNLSDIVSRTAEKIFIPLTVGGGIRNIEDIRGLLRAGADKVAINTSAVHNPKFIEQAAKSFGSQCVVLSVEAKKINGRYLAFTDNGREPTGQEVLSWVKKAVDLGAGEILLTSIDREGTGRGFDLELCSMIAEATTVPVIACGGCGSPEHFREVINSGKADAVSAASVFHYHHLEELKDNENYKDEGNIDFIKRHRGELEFKQNQLKPTSIKSVKFFLTKTGIDCRIDGLRSPEGSPETEINNMNQTSEKTLSSMPQKKSFISGLSFGPFSSLS